MRDERSPSGAHLTLPAWLWGDQPHRFLEEARLRLRGSADGRLFVQTIEGYENTRPGLVTSTTVAGPSCASRFDLLSVADPYAVDSRDDITQHVDTLAAKAEASMDFKDLIRYWQLATMTAPHTSLSEFAAHAYDQLREIPFSGEPGERAFPHASIHVITRAGALVHRTELAPLWLRLKFDRQMASGDLSHVLEAHRAGDLVFDSSGGLRDGVFLFDAYVGPLIGALSPYMWAFPAHRGRYTVIYAFGRAVRGTVGGPSELLHLLPTQGPDRTVETPILSLTAATAAVSWWASRLDALFGVITDLSVFTDRTGAYVPAKHLYAMLSVEQLFRRVTSIQASDRDSNARRVLLFTVLDTIERLTGREIERVCSHEFATATLQLLKERIPADAAEVLLPAATRAVEALAELQDGFFMRDRITEGALRLERSDGTFEDLPLSAASAHYIRVLRDATHGHGTNKQGRVQRTEALLASHDGTIPHDLALLGYLYLLRVLVEIDGLKSNLYRQGNV